MPLEIGTEIENEISHNKGIKLHNFTDLNNRINEQSFKMILINIRSLNANLSKLEVFIKNIKNKPDIIACTETWLLPIDKYHNIEGYNIYYNSSQINKADGVAMYIKKDLLHKPQIETYNELKILSTTINLNGNDFKISTIYRCHDLPEQNFLQSLNEFLLNNKKIQNHCIMGDFNIDILTNDQTSNEFTNTLFESQYLPLINDITRPSNTNIQQGSCIDNFFIKTTLSNFQPYIFLTDITDHFPLILEIKQQIKTTKYDLNQGALVINYKKINNKIKKQNWTQVTDSDKVEDSMNNFIDIISNIINTSTSTVSKPKKLTRRSKWITNGIINSSITKQNLYISWNRNRNCAETHTEYKKYLKVYNKVVKQAKHNSELKQVNEKKGQ